MGSSEDYEIIGTGLNQQITANYRKFLNHAIVKPSE
jgi:hypothetical protein